MFRIETDQFYGGRGRSSTDDTTESVAQVYLFDKINLGKVLAVLEPGSSAGVVHRPFFQAKRPAATGLRPICNYAKAPRIPFCHQSAASVQPGRAGTAAQNPVEEHKGRRTLQGGLPGYFSLAYGATKAAVLFDGGSTPRVRSPQACALLAWKLASAEQHSQSESEA